jgi:hypothetical protein
MVRRAHPERLHVVRGDLMVALHLFALSLLSEAIRSKALLTQQSILTAIANKE